MEWKSCVGHTRCFDAMGVLESTIKHILAAKEAGQRHDFRVPAFFWIPILTLSASEILVQRRAKLCIFSMGNFVSNQRRGASGYPLTNKERAEDSMLVQVEFIKDPYTGKTTISKVDHIPTWLWRYTENGGFKFKVIPVPSVGYYTNEEFPQDALNEAYASYERTMKLVTDYDVKQEQAK
jgi:hypothetical protein